MAFISLLRKVFYTAISAVGMIFAPLVLCTSTWLQRHAFYAHKAPLHWGQDLDHPEKFGYLHRQVTPLRLPTSDGESLYAWLVMPLKRYSKHQHSLLRQKGDQKDLALKLLTEDGNSRIVIYMHGMAGTVGQTRRTDAYRLISSSDSDHLYVLAFDYRGFGRSTGFPTESGLIEDAVSVIKWAMEVAKVPPHRIVLCAQSLGTAVASGAVERCLAQRPQIELRGLVLCAAVRDAKSVLLSLTIGGYLPLLAPFRAFPAATRWFARRIRDQWSTSERLKSIIDSSKTLKLTFVHAMDDTVIPWRHTEETFASAVKWGLGGQSGSKTSQTTVERTDMGEGGWSERFVSDQKSIEKIIVRHGGHNGIMKWNQVALAVHRMFETG